MRTLTLLLFVACIGSSPLLHSQQTLSLAQAKDYALKNAPVITQSHYDQELAAIQTKQLLALGLPQVNGSVQFQNYLNLPTSIIPAGIFSPVDLKVQFGVPYTMSAGISATQLLFDGTWLVGLQASQEYAKLTQSQVSKTEFDLKHNVTQSYHFALIANESLRILNQNKITVSKSLSDTKAMLKEGFVEDQAVDQLQLMLNDIESKMNVAEASKQVSLDMLKLLIGMPVSTAIELSDKLEDVSNTGTESILETNVNIENNWDVKITSQALGMQQLNLKAKKASTLPSMAAFYNYQKQAQRREFNFFDSDQDWFPIQIWGLQMSIPVFAGGGRYHSIHKANVEVEKMKTNLNSMKQVATVQYNMAKATYLTALSNMTTAKSSMELSARILEKTNIKFKEGLATSFELSQANGQYIQAQATYIQALLQQLNAKDQLLKALNQ
jgi:outer membrane protein